MTDRDGRRPAGAARSLLAEGVGLLHPEQPVLEAMLQGWEHQMMARNLQNGCPENSGPIIGQMLGYHIHTTEHRATDAAATWSRYAALRINDA